MIKNFVLKYTKLVVSRPDEVIVKEQKNNSFTSIAICVHPDDMGKMIGKNANMITAISTFIGVCSVKDKTYYKVFVKNIHEDN